MGIERAALPTLTLDRYTVGAIFDCATLMTHEKAIEELRRICLSHERMRLEYEGLQTLYQECDNSVT